MRRYPDAYNDYKKKAIPILLLSIIIFCQKVINRFETEHASATNIFDVVI